MVIQRYGSYFVKLTAGDKTIGINPPSKESKLKEGRFGSDVALVSVNHPDFDGVNFLEHKSKDCYVVRGPGEYEIQDIFIHGFSNPTKYDGVDEQINTVYSVLFDNINVAYLGPVQNTDISEETKEELYQADVIFVPVGGDNVLEADEAYKFVKQFSPKIVIPVAGDTKAEQAFASNFGDSSKPEDKLTIKKRDVEGEGMDVVLLKEV